MRVKIDISEAGPTSGDSAAITTGQHVRDHRKSNGAESATTRNDPPSLGSK
jgi:hypothetical protein